jgi:hypothetical protein
MLCSVCFRERLEKLDITWALNHTVTYRQVRRWHFDRQNSNGSLSDSVTSLNMLPVVRPLNETLAYCLYGEKKTHDKRSYGNKMAVSYRLSVG